MHGEIFLLFLKKLEALNLKYMVTGSVASMVYGEPRLTHDIDIVLEMSEAQIADLENAFPLEEFYFPPRENLSIELKRGNRGHFNIIHHDTGFKADFYLFHRDPLHAWGLARCRALDLSGTIIHVAPPEYVILRKLEFFREGGSEKHLRDIRALLDTSGHLLDWQFLNQKIIDLGLQTQWELAKNFG